MVKHKYIICQKNKLYLRLLVNQKVRKVYIINNVDYNKKARNKFVSIKKF